MPDQDKNQQRLHSSKQHNKSALCVRESSDKPGVESSLLWACFFFGELLSLHGSWCPFGAGALISTGLDSRTVQGDTCKAPWTVCPMTCPWCK
jgi:hypothetical protein